MAIRFGYQSVNDPSEGKFARTHTRAKDKLLWVYMSLVGQGMSHELQAIERPGEPRDIT